MTIPSLLTGHKSHRHPTPFAGMKEPDQTDQGSLFHMLDLGSRHRGPRIPSMPEQMVVQSRQLYGPARPLTAKREASALDMLSTVS